MWGLDPYSWWLAVKRRNWELRARRAAHRHRAVESVGVPIRARICAGFIRGGRFWGAHLSDSLSRPRWGARQ